MFNKDNKRNLHPTLTAILLCLSSYRISVSADISEKNVDCGLHKQVVQTDSDKKYIPYYVELYRCLGKNIDDNPHGKVCSPTETSLVEYFVTLVTTPNRYSIKLENHTACEYKCIGDDTWCTRDQLWNVDLCTCCPRVYPCEEMFEWDEMKCKCICPNTSTDNCGLAEFKLKEVVTFLNKNVRMKYVWTIAAGEGLLLVTLCFLVFYFFCRGNKCSACACHKDTYKTQKSDDTKRNSDSMSEVSFSKLNSPFNKCERNGYAEEFSERERFLSF